MTNTQKKIWQFLVELHKTNTSYVVFTSVSEYLWDRGQYGPAQSMSSSILAMEEAILVQV